MADPQAFLQRACCPLAIERAVISLFPGSPAMAGCWVTTPSAALGGKAPLQIMLEDGLEGMHFVRAHPNGEWQ